MSSYIKPVICTAARVKPHPTDFELAMTSIKIYVATLSLVALVQCHSYVVEARTIIQGTFIGAPGYPRAYGMFQTFRAMSWLATLTCSS